MNFIIDRITELNKGEILAYTGAEDGQFIQTEGNKLSLGTYIGGIPYITDALFTVSKSVEYPTSSAAQEKALNLCGMDSILHLFSGVYVQYIKGADGQLFRRGENGELILLNNTK
jgi:hypothetical protein